MSPTPLICIIDDDEEVRVATAALMRSLGYRARAFESALAFLKADALGESACLIVDVQMPGMTGPELQRHVLAGSVPRPFVFITAFPDLAVRECVLKSGAVEVLGKPCDGQALVDAVERALVRGQ